jgi:hypothetical protein
MKYTFQYDSNGNNIEEIQQIGNDSNDTWTNYWRVVNNFSQNLITDYTTYNWKNNTWVKISYSQCSYDSWITDNYTNDSISSSTKVIFSYDSNKNITEILQQTGKNPNATWTNYSHSVNNYSQNLISDNTSYIWTNNAWVKNSYSQYSYNLAGKTDYVISDSYSNGSISSSTRETYSYDGNGNIIDLLVQSGRNPNATWTNNMRNVYNYQLITITGFIESNNKLYDYSLSQNYPNPFNPSTLISYSLPYASDVKIIVYNSLGQTVRVIENGFKIAGNYSVTFNAANLPSGIYFYKLEAGQLSLVKKMILVK